MVTNSCSNGVNADNKSSWMRGWHCSQYFEVLNLKSNSITNFQYCKRRLKNDHMQVKTGKNLINLVPFSASTANTLDIRLYDWIYICFFSQWLYLSFTKNN